MSTSATIPAAQSAALEPQPTPNEASELFALTDEQILEIEPAPAPPATQEAQPPAAATAASGASQEPQSTARTVPGEPPRWLAEMMADPQTSAEARELWNGVQQARSESAAYREVFARPEEARAAAERARALEEIDAAFFGAAGKTAADVSAGRTALAQRMLREDPAAFREMVFAGLRALEEAAQPAAAQGRTVAEKSGSAVVSGATIPAPQLAAYSAFEKSANEELERGVGSAIERSLRTALPNLAHDELRRASTGASLQGRLRQSVRDEVEAGLKADQQLGEQLSRVLAARSFDGGTLTQVVRLIQERAQQLIPGATRRVVQEWTQAALSANRGPDSERPSGVLAPGAAGNAGTLVRTNGPANTQLNSQTGARNAAPVASAKAAAANRAEKSAGLDLAAASRGPRRVDYNRLSDEQILEL